MRFFLSAGLFFFSLLIFSFTTVFGNYFVNNKVLKRSSSLKRPSFFFILVDDLGYNDMGFPGIKQGIQTPNIDRLKSEGMYFPQAYASSPVCSPTRASIMTGKYPARLKLTCHIPGMGMEKYLGRMNEGKKLKEAFFIDRLPLDEITIAELLKKEGYKTAFLGKWHLAGEGSVKTSDGIVDARYHPDNMGFDLNIGGCAYGQPASYFSPYRNGTITDGPQGEYLTDRLGDEAVRFIHENAGNPFFLMLATYTVHTPLAAPVENVKRNKGNTYFAMIEKLDENIGKVLNELDKQGITENTMIMFNSDNGGFWGNSPLRGIKGSLFEGGIKVPFIVRWPGHIQAGTINETIVTSVDILPTILDAIGVTPFEETIDGVSLMPALTGADFQERGPVYWHYPHHRNTPGAMGAAVRDGKWKYIYLFEKDSSFLFNLDTDPGEHNNLADQMPEEVTGFYKKLSHWQKSVDAEIPGFNY